MRVKKVELNNFRNYEALILEFGAPVGISAQGFNCPIPAGGITDPVRLTPTGVASLPSNGCGSCSNASPSTHGSRFQKTLIIGQNAQGKTNLLEAIYYLSSLDSPRIRKDAELILFGQESCRFGAMVEKEGVDVELEVIIAPPKNKVFRVNGLKKNKSSEFIRVLSVVNFSVNDLLLLRGEPGFRRKWLDGAICQIYPVYSEKIAKYNKIRLQKANLLGAGGMINSDVLDVFNGQLATSGANIIFLRRKFLIELEKIAAQKHSKIAQGEALSMNYDEGSERNKNKVFDFRASESQGRSPYDCDLAYGFSRRLPVPRPSPNDSNGSLTAAQGHLQENPSAAYPQTAKEIEAALLAKLEEIKHEEIRRAQCLVGPHRDDISFFINGIDAKKFASQGQQRTIVLALKLAELEIIKEKNNDTPVLLLDDVLAELDETRQNYLLNGIEDDIQTIITCTDTKAFSKEFLNDLQIVEIENGKLM